MNEKEILLHHLIDTNQEDAAIELVNSDETLNVNYEHNGRKPIISAINQEMFNLFEAISHHPKANLTIEDGFGEPLLHSLLYLSLSDELKEDKEAKEACDRLIRSLLNNDKYDLNGKDINEDTPLITAFCDERLLWVVEELLKKENVDINCVNDVDESALYKAIKNNNTKAIELLAKRKDLVVTDEMVQIAKDYDIDLTEYGIDISHPKTAEAFAMACS